MLYEVITGFDFNIDIYQGAGAFVCGEETALMRSIEGKRGMPRPRPPFPAHRGLWEKPTILNNVETLANIPQIILNGGKWYASIGTESSKGTKVFALTGDVNKIGLVEIPMGTSLVITSYSIHYTKLYESRTSARGTHRHRSRPRSAPRYPPPVRALRIGRACGTGRLRSTRGARSASRVPRNGAVRVGPVVGIRSGTSSWAATTRATRA